MTQTLAVSPSPVNAPAPSPAREGRRRRRHRPDGDGHGAAAASRPEGRLSIRLLQAFDVCFARIYHRVNVLSPQRLPKHGPAILICNHVSGLDPMLIQSVCPRLIVWMMAKEYYEIPVLRSVFKAVEAIPVDRGGRDLAATRSALRALEAGRILGVFPEGRIETSHELLPFQTGVAMMAVKAGVPVYPAYLDGTQRRKNMLQAFLYPHVASLAFGPQVEFEAASTSKEVLQSITDRFAESIDRLRSASERAAPPRRPADR
jgi:1-acyl-sn-glycerol-3-phosphate acyltransferase